MSRPALVFFAFAICVHAIPAPAIIRSFATTENTLSVANDQQPTIIDYINGFSDTDNENNINNGMNNNNYDQDVDPSYNSDENEKHYVTTKGGSNHAQSTTDNSIKSDELDNTQKSVASDSNHNDNEQNGSSNENKQNEQNDKGNANTGKNYFSVHEIPESSKESEYSQDKKETNGRNTKIRTYFDISNHSNENDDISDKEVNHNKKDNSQHNIGEEKNRNVKTGNIAAGSDESKTNLSPEIQIPYWEVDNKISQTTEKSDNYDDNLGDVSSNNNTLLSIFELLSKSFNDSKIQKPSNAEDHTIEKTEKISDHPRIPKNNDSQPQEIQHPYWEIAHSKNSDEIGTKASKPNNTDGTRNKVLPYWKVTDEKVGSSSKSQNNNDNYETKKSKTQRPYWEISEGQDQIDEKSGERINENNDPRKNEGRRWSHGEDTTAEDEGYDKSKKNRDNHGDESSSESNGFISQIPYWEIIARKLESGESKQNNDKRMDANENHNTNNNQRPNWEDFNRRSYESEESDSNSKEDNTHSHRNEYSKDDNRRNRNEDDSEENDRSYENQLPCDNNHRHIKDEDRLNNNPNERKVYTKPSDDKPCNCYNRYRYNKNKQSQNYHNFNRDGHRHYYRNNKYSYQKQYHSNPKNYDDKYNNKCKCPGYYSYRTNYNKKYDVGQSYKFSNTHDEKHNRQSHSKFEDNNYHGNRDYNNKNYKDNSAGYNRYYNSKYRGYYNKHMNYDRDHNDNYDGGHYKKNYYKTKYDDRSWNDNKRHHGGTRYNVKKDGYSSQYNNDKYRHIEKSDRTNYERDENNNYHRSNNYGKESGNKGSSYRNRGEYHQ